MKTVISLESNFSDQSLLEKSSDDDPKQLKKIISHLIEKSKSILLTLQDTLSKLEKTQFERDYWKNNYFHLKQSCQQYIEEKALEPFGYICNLEDKIKKLIIEKEAIEDSRFSFKQRSKKISRQIDLRTIEKRREGHKSISTISYNKENPQSTHKIKPKKLNIMKYDHKNLQDF